MSRYIDAEWLIKESMPLSFSVQKRVNEVQIMTAPSIEIVRCRECKYWVDDRKSEDDMGICGLTHYFTNTDDFCSYGEREGE